MSNSEFENNWLQKLENGILKSFPDDFIVDKGFEILQLPCKPLVKGSELFGSFEIIDVDGIPLLTTDNPNKIKYILYSNRKTPKEVKVITNNEELTSSVKEYEKHLDDIVRLITEDFSNQFPDSDQATFTTNKIFQLLNLYRH